MVLLNDLVTFLNEFMGFDETVPRIDSYLANGLQVAGKAEIAKIATGVSANLQFFEQAVAANAEALLVHHSLNPPTSVHFEQDTIFSKRLKYLWSHNLSLIGYHYLLDNHPQVGNNAAIIRALGGELVEPYGQDGWGWVGNIPGGADLNSLMETCRALFQNNGWYYSLGNKTVHRLVSLSGAGTPRPSDYAWLVENKIDLFITGEPREWNRELCREAEVSLVAAGHYNTEIIGLQKLGEVIQQQFAVEVEFIDVPNDV